MSFEVIVPDGCAPGDEFLVETESGQQFHVTVPPDTFSGMAILVDLPAPNELLDVVVPDGCGPGDQFLVEHGELQFSVVVPEGLGPGSLMQVEVAAACTAAAPSAPAAAPSAAQSGASIPGAKDESDRPPKRPPITLSLGLIGGLELNLSLSACAKFKVGQQAAAPSRMALSSCRTDAHVPHLVRWRCIGLTARGQQRL